MKRLFFLSLFCSALCISLNATVYSGNCGAEGDGSNLRWTFDDETGALDITGSGAMADWSYNSPTPWYPYLPLITSITIGNSVTSIGTRAFYNCWGPTSVIIPNSVTSIGENAFGQVLNIIYSGTATGSPWGARSVNGYVEGYLAYSDATKTTLLACSREAKGEIAIPNGVISIGEQAFIYCSGLTSVTIPNGVTSIGNNAFWNCSSLTSVTIPNSVTSIGNGAFGCCTNLTSVTIGNGVTNIGEDAFYYCPYLTSVIWNAKNCINSGSFGENVTSFTFGDVVESIPEACCAGMKKLTNITIPNSVTSIGNRAFAYVPNIVYYGEATGSPWGARSVNGYVEGFLVYNDTKTNLLACFSSATGTIEIPNGVTSIEEGAFYKCSGLTSIAIPISVTSIGRLAFYGCSNLTSLTIPNSVTSIGEGGVSNCPGLTSVICDAVTPPNCGLDVFYNVNKSIPLYVPAGSVDTYKAAGQWKNFMNIQPIQQAAEAVVTEIEAEPAENSVVIEWPSVAEATIYTIEIKKNGELICTLTFNELGQLQNIAFAKPSRNGGRDSQVRSATQTTTGWKYTVAGLEPNTTYSYNVIAKRNASDTENLYNETITFTTKNTPTDIDAVVDAESQSKQIRNGQLYILRNGEVYNAQGARVE